MDLRIKTPPAKDDDSDCENVSPSDFESPLEVTHLGTPRQATAMRHSGHMICTGMIAILFLAIGITQQLLHMIVFGVLFVVIALRNGA